MKPTMNMACVNKCVKGGKTRSACMKTCYGDSPSKGKKGGDAGDSKKKAPFKKRSSY
jgi:hypothetical protein